MLNAVIISSAIHTNNSPLSYTPTRSHFTHEQRFQQTLDTIAHLREKIPNVYIILIEVTKLSDEYQTILEKRVDYLYLTCNIPYIYQITEGPYKGYGEAISILTYLNSDHFKHYRNQFISVSKISGRYKPNNHFRFEIAKDMILCKLNTNNPDHYSRLHMSTMFYTIDISIIDMFIKALENTCNHTEIQEGIALEHILPISIINNNIKLIIKEHLFVEGEYGPWGGYVMH